MFKTNTNRFVVFYTSEQVYHGGGSEASSPDQAAEEDRSIFHRSTTEEERFCGHHTAVKGRREEEIRIRSNILFIYNLYNSKLLVCDSLQTIKQFCLSTG